MDKQPETTNQSADSTLGDSVSKLGSSSYSDPTYNVLQLVNAAVKRLDDLGASERDKNREIIGLNKEILNLHVLYGEKLSFAESKRIDAIRAVDVGAVAIASERSSQQATVLANQVASSADTLRTLVASTATTVANQFSTVTNQLMEKIAALEKSQYVGIGKERVSDPIIAELLAEVKSLKEARSEKTGSGAGMEKMWGWIVAAAFLAFAIYKSVNN